jgi:hypothetical protein
MKAPSIDKLSLGSSLRPLILLSTSEDSELLMKFHKKTAMTLNILLHQIHLRRIQKKMIRAARKSQAKSPRKIKQRKNTKVAAMKEMIKMIKTIEKVIEMEWTLIQAMDLIQMALVNLLPCHQANCPILIKTIILHQKERDGLSPKSKHTLQI